MNSSTTMTMSASTASTTSTTPATTITSLLNSLHTHLQSQTQILPTLHAQLGLPPTALTDELTMLQQKLTQCIEGQIDIRKKQVDEWMMKCLEVEDNCLRYGRALGNHAMKAGSVGEIRKELVLPRRFELVSEFQEKMRQLYHTKLEQLLTITNRLATLSRTLGPEFFAEDILEPTPAAGEKEFDPDSHRDVTPERFSKLEKELVRGKGEVAKRLTQLSQMMVQIDWLYTELGMSPPTIEDIPSASSTLGIPMFPRPTSACSVNSDPFLSTSMAVSTPTPEGRLKSTTPFMLAASSRDEVLLPEMEYERIFAKFVARLEELSEEDLADVTKPTVGLEGVEPSPGLLLWAERKMAELDDIKRRRETYIQTMYDQLEALWRRLGVAEKDMDAFVEANRGSTEETVRAYEEELDRMLELKRERMSVFVENAREEIRKLWDDLMVGAEERADFAPFADDEHTEELLCIHEEEIRRLKEEKRLKGSLLKSIQKYFEILDDEKELAAAAADQNRLLGRGPRDPGRLLREEKMRKRVTKEKPRLEQDLLVSIPAWEAETGRPFLVHGQSIVRILMDTVGSIDKENTNGKRGGKPPSRSGSVPPRAKTPSNPSNHYAPGSTHGNTKSNAVTPAVRPPSRGGANTRSASNKRPRLGESTSSYNNAAATLATSRSVSNRPASPSKIPSKTPSSALPRPVSIAMPVPKPGTQHHILGHGRVPSTQQHSSHSYHPYPQTQRSTSSGGIRVYGAVSHGVAVAPVTAGAARKASRVRRESFKPRPSVDGEWTAHEGNRRWPGFAGGAVREEEEDY
ncbi:hypothetical protein K474DRAFT_1668836 [Panus rudis PR-1116 ss-1]|nr:hypothetical protein K474DRAFT_1668836 [Panus rudis PR-1116 ss-1]